MFQYFAMAAVRKIFSATGAMRSFFARCQGSCQAKRAIYTEFSNEERSNLRQVIELFDRHRPLLGTEQILVISRGGQPWEATLLRLFHDVSVTLLEVSDTRHLAAYKSQCAQLGRCILEEGWLSLERRRRAIPLLQGIAGTKTWDEVDDLLGFRQVVNPSGALGTFLDQSFDIVFSWSALEHVSQETLPNLMKEIVRVLKPGGVSLHKIDLSDPLYPWDPSVSPKNYLRYSDSQWQRWFENESQPFNRVQRPEWLRLFRTSGLTSRNEEPMFTDIGNVPLADDFSSLSRDDANCVWLYMVHQKAAAIVPTKTTATQPVASPLPTSTSPINSLTAVSPPSSTLPPLDITASATISNHHAAR